MWIPVITILWALGDSATWVNFPMVNFPFSSSDKCYQYIDSARSKILLISLRHIVRFTCHN